MFQKLIPILFFSVLFLSCNTNKVLDKNKFVSVKGNSFVDSFNRQIILSGTNYISKNPEEKFIPERNPEIFEKFRNWGFNCIRLGIIWEGLEPEPGKYNEEYLKKVDTLIQLAAQNEIYVLLDMHQDLYSSKFSDGAPGWATFDEEKPHFTGSVWSDSYLISPAVQTAFDNFWKNTPASDGIGIQDHYANLWKHIAERYANNPSVLGYDVMNEPFMGTSANEILPLMLGAYARVFSEYTGQNPPSVEELGVLWSTEESRMKALEFLSSAERYSKVVDAIYEVNAEFEKNELQNMYQKVADAIREADKNHILFFNHSYFANTGVISAIEPTKLADGTTDSLVAYAAHGYDLVVDTKEVDNPGFERVEFIFNRISETGQRLNIPVLIGEWGALHGNSMKMVETARHLVNTLENHNFSNAYWCYYNTISEDPYFKAAIVRPYPQYVSGSLIQYDYHFDTGEFICSWNETGETVSPTVIYVPNMKNLSENDIHLDPSAEQIVFEYCEKSNAGKLLISPVGYKTSRTLQFNLLPEKSEEFSIK